MKFVCLLTFDQWFIVKKIADIMAEADDEFLSLYLPPADRMINSQINYSQLNCRVC